MNIEKRTYNSGQWAVDSDQRMVTGMASLYNSDSVDLGGFIERIAPGAFKNAIGVSDVRALLNHDPNHLLGRTASGTLKLMETEEGLQYELSLPESRQDVLEMVKRGDLTQNSFAFTIAKGGDRWEERDGKYYRTITAIDKVYDISLVTYPAYPDTTVALRSMEEYRKEVVGVEVKPNIGYPYEQIIRMNEIRANGEL